MQAGNRKTPADSMRNLFCINDGPSSKKINNTISFSEEKKGTQRVDEVTFTESEYDIKANQYIVFDFPKVKSSSEKKVFQNQGARKKQLD